MKLHSKCLQSLEQQNFINKFQPKYKLLLKVQQPTSQQVDQKMQSSQLPKMCRIHSEQKGQYYIIEQPWNKLCRQCALNHALCGYKIEKNLSPQQFQNKLILSTLTQELKEIIENCEQNSKEKKEVVQKINNQLCEFALKVVECMDQHIQKLTGVRNQILELNQNRILFIRKQYNQIHNNFVVEQVKFKNLLENLQANFGDIIADGRENEDGEEQFTIQIKMIKSQMEKYRKNVEGEGKNNTQEIVNEIKGKLEEKLKEFEAKSHFTNQFGKNQPPQILGQEKDGKSNNQVPDHKIKKLTLATLSKAKSVLQSKQNQNFSRDAKNYFSHRKKSSSEIVTNAQQRKLSLVVSFSQVGQRTPNIILKSVKRNSSISKNTLEVKGKIKQG